MEETGIDKQVGNRSGRGAVEEKEERMEAAAGGGAEYHARTRSYILNHHACRGTQMHARASLQLHANVIALLNIVACTRRHSHTHKYACMVVHKLEYIYDCKGILHTC